jgi:tRNA threonylcarbamoyladenosine biosynthesis protein TsaB
MKVLSIDTSNYVLGIGLLDGDSVMGEYISNIKKNHSVRVMPAIENLMKECGIEPRDLGKIVVAEGPGSYTGVRIGVTIAKTLAWTLKIPLSGVSSLEVSAASAGRYFDGPISPLFDARRGQIYTGLYAFKNQFLHAEKKDQLVMAVDWVELLKKLDSRVLFTGNDLHLHEAVIKEGLGDQAVFAAVTGHNPRPGELALLGRDKENVDIHAFVPNYIRMAEAETNWLKSQNNTK